MLMGANLLETRIPDAHYMTEARINGTKIVVVAPEYNPTAIHADEFIAIKPGTDGALCLAMANVIVERGLYDAAYVKQFTDMPFLVRTDAGAGFGRFLREADVVTGGSAEKFYVWDTATGAAVLGPARSARARPSTAGSTWARSVLPWKGHSPSTVFPSRRFSPCSGRSSPPTRLRIWPRSRVSAPT